MELIKRAAVYRSIVSSGSISTPQIEDVQRDITQENFDDTIRYFAKVSDGWCIPNFPEGLDYLKGYYGKMIL